VTFFDDAIWINTVTPEDFTWMTEQ